jgi:hypothetical protein
MTIEIFVFGSNLAGRHGKGAALHAREDYGAVYGVANGRTGNAYAIPTKDKRLYTLPLPIIATYVDEFAEYVRNATGLHFIVTRVGCGLAGYKDADMAPLFVNVPPATCVFPLEWANILLTHEHGTSTK